MKCDTFTGMAVFFSSYFWSCIAIWDCYISLYACLHRTDFHLWCFCLCSFANIEDCKSPKRRLVLYRDSSSLTWTEEWVFACLSSSRNSNLYSNILAGTRFRNSRAQPRRRSTRDAIWEPGETEQVSCTEIHKSYLWMSSVVLILGIKFICGISI